MSGAHGVRRRLAQSLPALLTAFDEALPAGDGDVEVPAATWAEFLAARSTPTPLVLQLEARVAELEAERRLRVVEHAAQRGAEICRGLEGDGQTPRQARIWPGVDAFDVSGGKDDDGVKWIELKSGSVTFRMDDGTALALAYILRDTVGSLGTACNALSAINEPSAVPPPRKRKARTKKAYCGACNADTPHDGNDECTACAAREVQKLAQQKTPLEQAIEEKAGGAS